jgi:hypothetical protein
VVINSLCDSSNTLEPGNTKGYTVEYTDPTGINVIAHAQWAQDQAGCSPEASDLMGGDSCLASLDICGASCKPSSFEFLKCKSLKHFCLGDGGSDTANYGGGYILNIPDFGCVEWELYAQDSGSGSSACTCNEDGCTSSSPACCADSTCSTSEETVLASVHIIPDSAVLSKA